ncbi:MAG: hypothetical protein EOP39_12940 [Rubrivivax sp.]|nr:MAG: hypothetical protein EOP39_12940 [Rubrivivax sp.]
MASGVTGLIACALLMGAFMGRGSGALNQSQYILMFDLHDAVCALQFALLLPALSTLFERSRPHAGDQGCAGLYVGVISVYLVVATLLLALPRVLSNGLYSLPQGVFGVWLVYMCGRKLTLLGWPLRAFGMVVGTGLLLFGLFLVGYTIFVSTINFRIPAASVAEMESVPRRSEYLPASVHLDRCADGRVSVSGLDPADGRQAAPPRAARQRLTRGRLRTGPSMKKPARGRLLTSRG